MKKITLAAQLDDFDKRSAATAIDTGSEGGAQQHFKEECDINTIIKRNGLGYEMPIDARIPLQGDFSTISTFHDAMNKVVAARENFMLLPADIRSRFDNDPRKFHDFAIDKNNANDLADMGMLTDEARTRVKAEYEANELAKAKDLIRKRIPPVPEDTKGVAPTPGSKPLSSDPTQP